MILPYKRHSVPLYVYQIDSVKTCWASWKPAQKEQSIQKTSQYHLTVRADRFSPATMAPPTGDWVIGGIWGGTDCLCVVIGLFCRLYPQHTPSFETKLHRE